MTKTKEYDDLTSLLNVAITKGHNYAQDYDPVLGIVRDKTGYPFLKQGFVDGFLAGIAYRMSGGHDEQT